MEVKVLVMNHADASFSEKLNAIRKGGFGKEAHLLEKDYIHVSGKRLDIITKIVNKCESNSLVLFHSIEYGTKLFNTLKEALPDKEFFYIDGQVRNKEREEIKKQMENTDDGVKVLVASYGTLSTGVSINAIFNIIFADSFKSEQIIIQSIGRSLRLHSDKKKALIFDLVDTFTDIQPRNILYRHFLEREKFYKKRKYPYKITNIELS